MVKDGAPRVRASFELQFGALREVVARERPGHCRGEPGSALSGECAPDSARAEGSSIVDQGSTEPLCARIKGANREVSEGKADLWPGSVFLPTRANKERGTGKIHEAFSGMQRALDGWMLTRAPASPAQGLHHGPWFFNFPYFCIMCGIEKLGLVDQN